MSKWNDEQVEWMRKAAAGRVTVKRVHAGPETGFASRYRPKVAATFVSLTDSPKEGYLDADAARAAGIRYRAECRDELSKIEAA